VLSDAVSVPELVTGLPETVKMPGIDKPTLDTVAEPADAHDVFPDPSVIRTWFNEPFVFGN
jgi:hypothetical protein